jgi:hypothetical protein
MSVTELARPRLGRLVTGPLPGVFAVVYDCPSCGASWIGSNKGMALPACGKRRDEWCGQCYANVKGRARHAGHRGYRGAPSQGDGGKLPLKKPALVSGNGSVSLPVSSQSTYLSVFSGLLEFLSSVSWTDGSPRVRGTLSLTVTGGRWSARLKDPNRKGYCYLTGETVDGVLEAVEEGLSNDTLDWREDRPFRVVGK